MSPHTIKVSTPSERGVILILQGAMWFAFCQRDRYLVSFLSVPSVAPARAQVVTAVFDHTLPVETATRPIWPWLTLIAAEFFYSRWRY